MMFWLALAYLLLIVLVVLFFMGVHVEDES